MAERKKISKIKDKEYVMTYLDSKEYVEMKDSLNNILDNVVLLAKEYGFSEEVSQATLVTTLVAMGLLSEPRSYIYDTETTKIGFNNDIILELALELVATGKGCCRNTAPLAKLALDKFAIENKLIVTNLNVKQKLLLTKLKVMLANRCQLYGQVNHITNYVQSMDTSFLIEPTSNDFLAMLYYIDKGTIKIFDNYNRLNFMFGKMQRTKDSVFPAYNRGIFSQLPEMMDFEHMEKPTLEQQDEILNKYSKTVLTILSNLDLAEKFHDDNKDNFSNITNSYQKVLKREKSIIQGDK